MKQWTVFDLEFTDLIQTPLQETLHIACASIFSTGDTFPQVWYEDNSELYLSETTLVAFIQTLQQLESQGHTIVTWGGSSSDWKLLHKECPSLQTEIISMALRSVDIPMCSCMAIGTMMGLSSAAEAIGFKFKEESDSKEVPALWRSQNSEDKLKVLQHVSNDSYATMQVLLRSLEKKILPWISKKLEVKYWYNVEYCTVSECLQKELPKVPFPILSHQNPKLLARWLSGFLL